MKIIINNKTKDITDTVFIIKVYQFLHDAEISQHLKIFKDFMPITFENYVCICRRLKIGNGKEDALNYFMYILNKTQKEFEK